MAAPRFELVPYEPAEHELQIECTRALHRLLLPNVAWSAIDHAHSLDRRIGRNGRPIGILEAQKRKARGVKKGLPDYLFWHQGKSFAIELKKTADSDLADEQKDRLRELLAAGVLVKVCWSLDQVMRTVTDWGLTRPWRVAA
jgi:VRR-NUC domain